jgi:hypothetical protein
MAGFARVALEGEYRNQTIVNVLHYRSTAWLPLQGNPFEDVTTFIDAILGQVQTSFLACMLPGYKLNVMTGVGYSDSYGIVTPSPLVRTINQFGTFATDSSNGAAGAGTLSLRCGPQVQVNGIGTSRRNRGYLALGPLKDDHVDEESHISGAVFDAFNVFAQDVAAPITLLDPAVVLTPIRIHEKWIGAPPVRILVWRTYSDVLGYTVRRLATFRRSRQPEA